ncbi:resolvase [Streptomyces hygroscopicus]|nr:resolvase [Streptomyces hygroscopicus]AQW52823.1 resolvase [Streptomyces hygroscopicus]
MADPPVERYARPGVDAIARQVAERDPAARRKHRRLQDQLLAASDDKRRVILARRAEGQSIRQIAAAVKVSAVKVSVGVVHKTLNPTP